MSTTTFPKNLSISSMADSSRYVTFYKMGQCDIRLTGDRIIMKELWLPWYLDMALLDFFLWCLLKGMAFTDKLHTADDV